jgi:outer membrane protein OmpA-like peptidoglycan-associated protein
MKVVACLLLILILIVPSESRARLQEETTRLLDGIPNNWPEVNLQAWTSAGETNTFRLGDDIKFHFRTERDCYISLIYIDSRGLLTIISPDWGGGNNFLEAEKAVTYPSEHLGFQLIAEPPLGQDNVYVIATKDRIYLPEDGSYTDAYGIAEKISLALTEKRKALKADIAKLQLMVKGRSEDIEYKTRDIVSYFKKTRALRPTLQVEQPRMYLELHIRFDFDSANLTPHARKNLAEFGKSMLDPSLKEKRFIIAGHTDDIGEDDYNVELSRRRAESVKKYLVSQYGINPDILLTKAYGESKPHDPRKTEAARDANRRVEFELMP